MISRAAAHRGRLPHPMSTAAFPRTTLFDAARPGTLAVRLDDFLDRVAA